MDVLVIGGSGLVGSNILRIGQNDGESVQGTHLTSAADTDSIELDKTNESAVREVVADTSPDAVIDTAAFHAVDDCEEEREQAWRVNANGTRKVAVAADAVDAHFVYLSTDYVFAGHNEDAPYSESDPVAPVNYYGRTKYAGEQAARIPDQWTVLRPSVVFGSARANFVLWAKDELEQGNEIEIVDDQISCPTYAQDLARACLDIVRETRTGVFHATGPESLSRYEFTVQLADVFGYDTDLISPITTEEFGQEAPRPTNSSLDSSQLYDLLGTGFRSPTDAFRDMI